MMQPSEKTGYSDPLNDTGTFEQFLRVMIHQLRNALQALHMTLTLLEKQIGPNLDPKAEQYLRRARRVQQELERAVDDASAYRRIQGDHLNLEWVDLNLLIEDLCAESGWCERENCVVTHETLPVLWSDSALLRVVFEHLIRNGLQYNAQISRKATIAATPTDSQNACALTVEDNGIGIAPEQLPNLFQPYRHLAEEYGDGSGMGLFLARTAVERLGGTITVASNPGSGSCFTVTLPARASHPADSSAPPNPPA